MKNCRLSIKIFYLISLLKDKTYGLFLVTTLHTRTTDTKALAKLLGLGSKVIIGFKIQQADRCSQILLKCRSLPTQANLRFADEETLAVSDPKCIA